MANFFSNLFHNRKSFKATDQVKSNVEMDHHQEIYEKGEKEDEKIVFQF